MITTDTLAARFDGLAGIGVGPTGVHRMAWTEEDAATRAWFEEQAAGVGLRVDRDPAGNLWACPETDPPWWGVGSHLDSVRGGGLFDGPLGVACGFEIAARSEREIAVLSFADEEGARFNTPTFGSKALAGRLDLPAVLERRDDDGVSLRDAMRAAGVDPDAIGRAPEWFRSRLAGFIEIHIDQTTELARAGEPVGVVSGLAARTRLEVRLTGRADHAGTTPRSERRDALSAAARLIVGAEDLAGADSALDGDHGSPTVTASRIITRPNAPTTIAAEVRLWIDARAPGFAAIDGWREGLDVLVGELADRTGVEIEVTVASRSDPREFAPEVREALGRACEGVLGHVPPELVCFAGHDAGVVAELVPAAMLFVRNATGVSHSPDETVSLEDAAVAARVVARALEELA
ncbi:MAG TPA: Zn-dependent hydrolase [Solirubrobacteraceae bacterium]|nr:Zn-dependent hydrolase [Solirubrobacteraceae bacterium]